MWKRDEAVKPTGPAGPGAAPAQPSGTPPPAGAADAAQARPAMTDPQRGLEKTAVNIGKSVVIKGELNGSEDLTIEGQVEGKIELRQNVLTIGPNAKIKAQVFAKAIIVQGEVHGNVAASERVDIRDNGSVDGDLSAPRVAIADGAHFRGSIDMKPSAKPAQPAAGTTAGAQAPAPKPAETKPAAPAAPAAAGSAPAGQPSGQPSGQPTNPQGQR